MHGSRRFHRQRLRPRHFATRAQAVAIWPSCPKASGVRPNDEGAKRLAERALEMKARFASVKYTSTPAAAKHGRSAWASPAPAAGPASRSQVARGWRRSDSNHPMLADAVGLEAASRAPLRTRSTCCRCWPAAAGLDHRDAYGRMKRSSATPAQTAPSVRTTESSIGTNASGQPYPRFFLSAPIASLFRHLPAARISGRPHRFGAAQFFNAAPNSSTLWRIIAI